MKLISQPDMIAFPLLIAILMGCAIAVSAAGSGISLRRFLQGLTRSLRGRCRSRRRQPLLAVLAVALPILLVLGV